MPYAMLLMHNPHELLHNHVEWVLVGCWVFSGVIRSLPTPTPDSGKPYRFLHALLHWAGANFDKSPLPTLWRKGVK